MNKNIGFFVLQISVALYLFATGIIGITKKSAVGRIADSIFGGGDEIREAVGAIFKGGLADFLVIVIAICAIAAGVFLLLELFGVQLKITNLLLVILMIVWLVFIFLVDVYYPIKNKFPEFAVYLRHLAPHLMVLGGMACASKQFGGK